MVSSSRIFDSRRLVQQASVHCLKVCYSEALAGRCYSWLQDAKRHNLGPKLSDEPELHLVDQSQSMSYGRVLRKDESLAVGRFDGPGLRLCPSFRLGSSWHH